ncbi:MAG: D-glycero-D-manno-heptose 1,7-bisphosphate phosphatase [Verrucomicrobiota bacterium]
MLDRIEVCFHAGRAHADPCSCRKPQPGMLLAAAAALQIDLSRSYLIGDRWRDIDCARAVRCRAIFIDRGYGEPLREIPDATVCDFAAAVAFILQADPCLQRESPVNVPRP